MLCYEISVHNTTLQYKILYSAKYLKHPKKPGHLTERKTTSNETQRDVQGTGFTLASVYPEGILVVGMIKLNKEKLSVRCVSLFCTLQ